MVRGLVPSVKKPSVFGLVSVPCGTKPKGNRTELNYTLVYMYIIYYVECKGKYESLESIGV